MNEQDIKMAEQGVNGFMTMFVVWLQHQINNGTAGYGSRIERLEDRIQKQNEQINDLNARLKQFEAAPVAGGYDEKLFDTAMRDELKKKYGGK